MKSFESLEVICGHRTHGAFAIDMHQAAEWPSAIWRVALCMWGDSRSAGSNVYLYGEGRVGFVAANHLYILK